MQNLFKFSLYKILILPKTAKKTLSNLLNISLESFKKILSNLS